MKRILRGDRPKLNSALPVLSPCRVDAGSPSSNTHLLKLDLAKAVGADSLPPPPFRVTMCPPGIAEGAMSVEAMFPRFGLSLSSLSFRGGS